MRYVLAMLTCGALVLSAGCFSSTALGPVTSAICVLEKGPVSMGDTAVKADRTGRSQARGVLFVSWGDASISAAMRDGGITRVHHVDCETLSVIGAYAQWTTVVYGE